MLVDALAYLFLAGGVLHVAFRAARREEKGQEGPDASDEFLQLPWIGLLSCEALRWGLGLGAPHCEHCLVALFFLADIHYSRWLESKARAPIGAADSCDHAAEWELANQLPVPLVTAAALCALLPYDARPAWWPTLAQMFSFSATAITWPSALAFAAFTGGTLAYCSKAVNGDHGDIQERLGPLALAKPWAAPLFVLLNAANEEMLYRGMLQGALTGGAGLGMGWWLRALAAILATSGLYAVQHSGGGFLQGRLGTALMFVWGSALGFLRIISGGLLQPLVVHLAADGTAAYLIYYEEQRRQGRAYKLGKSSPPPSLDASPAREPRGRKQVKDNLVRDNMLHVLTVV